MVAIFRSTWWPSGALSEVGATRSRPLIAIYFTIASLTARGYLILSSCLTCVCVWLPFTDERLPAATADQRCSDPCVHGQLTHPSGTACEVHLDMCVSACLVVRAPKTAKPCRPRRRINIACTFVWYCRLQSSDVASLEVKHAYLCKHPHTRNSRNTYIHAYTLPIRTGTRTRTCMKQCTVVACRDFCIRFSYVYIGQRDMG